MSGRYPRLGVEEVLALADAVPELERFPTVDELIARSGQLAGAEPSVVSRRRIGTSRLGEPIHALTIGSGDRHALIFAGVHPNEPIGSLTTLHLAASLARDAALRDRLGYTWHIVGCIDPDGMRLNEGWFDGPVTRSEYGRHFYRPAADEQVEWTFPFDYKDAWFDRVMPETVALMRLIDEVRPSFMCSLHNGELGGVYYYLSCAAPELYPVLHALPSHFGLPLDTGEPEAPFIPVLAPGIYGEISMRDAYDYALQLGLDPLAAIDAGDSSNSYTARYGTFSLVSELPYWVHPAASDSSSSSRLYADVLRERSTQLGDLGGLLMATLDEVAPELRTNSPFLRATRKFAPGIERHATQEAKRSVLPESERPATVAEVFTGQDLVHCFRLRYGGMLLRALHAEVSTGNGTPGIRAALARLEDTYRRWSEDAQAATPAAAVPLRALVGVQYGAILASADHVAHASRDAGSVG